MTIKFPLKMSKRAFVCQLTLLNIDTYSNILIESSINTNEMYFRVNEKLIYVINIIFGINESIFSGYEQQKVYWRSVCKILANDDPKILLFLFKQESIHKKLILPSLCFVLGLYNCRTFLYRCRTVDCTL